MISENVNKDYYIVVHQSSDILWHHLSNFCKLLSNLLINVGISKKKCHWYFLWTQFEIKAFSKLRIVVKIFSGFIQVLSEKFGFISNKKLIELESLEHEYVNQKSLTHNFPE